MLFLVVCCVLYTKMKKIFPGISGTTFKSAICGKEGDGTRDERRDEPPGIITLSTTLVLTPLMHAFTDEYNGIIAAKSLCSYEKGFA